MIGIYLISAVLISLALFLNRNRSINYILISIFILLQWVLTIYEYNHVDNVELIYFTSDALAILFLVTLSVIYVPTSLHNYILSEG